MPATSYSQSAALASQGLASQNNINYHSENYEYNYNEYILNSNRSFANSKNILKTTLEDLKDTLEPLQNEYEEVMIGANPDRLEEFVKKSLQVFQEDLTHTTRNCAINKEQFHFFKNAYCFFSDKIQDAKRELKRKEELDKFAVFLWSSK